MGWKSGNIENEEGMEKWKNRKNILVFSHDVWFRVEKLRNIKLFCLIEKKNKRIENVDYINLVICPSTKKINIIVYMRKKKKLLVYLFIFEKGNDMSTIFLQQILNGRLLLVIIVRAKK